MKRSRKIFLFGGIGFATAVAAAAVALLLFWTDVIRVNTPDRETYPVHGVDVSEYQGEIDWQVLSAEDIRFVFMKATEGSSHVDSQFQNNLSGVKKTDLRFGAYHFFSFESPGKKQAAHFCRTVPVDHAMLPPVIDVEYYGDFHGFTEEEANKIRKELRDCVDSLESFYHKKLILYATERSYRDLIQGHFDDCGLWIRNVRSRPPEDLNWIFWQYSDRETLPGYHGEEEHIDMNVFCGTTEEFLHYGT